MGLLLNIGSRVWEPGDERPSSDELLESFAQRAQVPYSAVRAEPHGAEFDVAPTIVGPPTADARGRFELLADDVDRRVARRARHAACTRRRRAVRSCSSSAAAENAMNSLGRRVPIGLPYNPCFAHPDDLVDLGVADGDLLVLTSDHGTITVVAVRRPHAAARRAVDHALLWKSPRRRRRPAPVRREPGPSAQPHRPPPTHQPDALDERGPRDRHPPPRTGVNKPGHSWFADASLRREVSGTAIALGGEATPFGMLSGAEVKNAS